MSSVGAPLALYLGTHADELDERVATTQCALDVVDYGTRKRGDDRHAGAEHRDAALARFSPSDPHGVAFRPVAPLVDAADPPPPAKTSERQAHAARSLIEIEAALKAHLHTVARSNVRLR